MKKCLTVSCDPVLVDECDYFHKNGPLRMASFSSYPMRDSNHFFPSSSAGYLKKTVNTELALLEEEKTVRRSSL